MEAVVGDWYVEIKGKERHFRVNYANTFDEPVGGLMNVLLTEDGQHYQYTNINGGRALAIDIGGFTTDWLPNQSTHPSRLFVKKTQNKKSGMDAGFCLIITP
jgi:hypothetical protein